MENSKVLPLHPIDLKSRPHNHRALAWSSDAELAVAADDSVTIYLPAFPFLDPAQPFSPDDDNNNAPQQPSSDPAPQGENGMGILPANLPANDEGDDDLGSGDEEEDEEDDDEEDDEGTFDDNGSVTMNLQRLEQAQAQERRQYSDEMSRVLWVSYPALHPELNLHVWEAAGKAMPLIRSGVGTVEDEGGLFGDGARVLPPDEGEDQVVEDVKEEESSTQEVNTHPGAGTGVIGGAGSSLNHVVAVEWSPSGLGKNLRPVLAVLTGCGSLAVYGEGGPLPFGSNAKPSRVNSMGKSAVRDLQSWLVLWAVGENFVVPGQEEFGYGEFVKSFAWCQEVGAGRALLSYMNDLREIVILSIGTTFQKTKDGLSEAVWNVQEIARMETGGPHGQVDTCDPDYVPSASSYCLRLSPWTKDKDTWSCLLSYMDRNYVGFKKVTINAPTWIPGQMPTLGCESADWDGQCTHLATDAFLEFEDRIWNVNGNFICRGFIATPLLAESFEVNLSTRAAPKPTHSTGKCNTTFPPQPINNPITGLIIHPISLETTAPPLTPLYTAVRLSATATNPQWTESNLPTSSPSSSTLQWLTTIQALVTRTIPLGRAGREGDPTAEAKEDGEDGIVRGPDDEGFGGHDDTNTKSANNNGGGGDGDDDDNSDDDDEDLDPDADFDPWANEGPDVHPYNMRLWGLARSPGGGSTAVLATPLLTQRPMRGAWGAHRSRVLFGWRTRVGDKAAAEPITEEENQNANSTTTTTTTTLATVSVDKLTTTEARLWEWMYGGGPGVLGLTPRLAPDALESARRSTSAAQNAQDENAMAQRAKVQEICQPFAVAQRCGVCGEEEEGSALKPVIVVVVGEEAARVLNAVCARGHRVAVCGVTGLAIMAPGISRACGVCQSRSLGWEYLLERVLGPGGVGEEMVDVVRGVMAQDVCARCGGKYLD